MLSSFKSFSFPLKTKTGIENMGKSAMQQSTGTPSTSVKFYPKT